jgi:hypothetical protein
MPYRDCLNRWFIIRLLPNMQRVTVAAFYRRSDAEGHLQILRRLIPNGEFVIVFNPKIGSDRSDV